jgi:hypothetical protein
MSRREQEKKTEIKRQMAKGQGQVTGDRKTKCTIKRQKTKGN